MVGGRLSWGLPSIALIDGGLRHGPANGLLHDSSHYVDLGPIAGVTCIASSSPSVSTAMCTLAPVRLFAPSQPDRSPLSSVLYRVRLSRTIAVGWGVRPSPIRISSRRSAMMDVKASASI